MLTVADAPRLPGANPEGAALLRVQTPRMTRRLATGARCGDYGGTAQRCQYGSEHQQHRSRLRSRHSGPERRIARVARRRHRHASWSERRREDDHPQGRVQSSEGRAWRRDQGRDIVERRTHRHALAERPGATGVHSGDGRAPLLRTPDNRGKSAGRRIQSQGRPVAHRRGSGAGLFVFPAPEGAPDGTGRLHLRRRTADVRNRPCADVAPHRDASG